MAFDTDSFDKMHKPHLKDKHHHVCDHISIPDYFDLHRQYPIQFKQDQSIDISTWKLSSSITILYHGKIYKLPRDTTKTWTDIMKNAISMKKRYGMIFLYHQNKAHYFAFFDSIEKCRIFSTTNDMSLSQIEALTTELWNLSREFSTVRYANSFQVGLTLVLETRKDSVELHGIKRYIQALTSKQAQHWFQCVNGVLMQTSLDKMRVVDSDDQLEESLDSPKNKSSTDDLRLEEEDLD